MMLFHNRSSYFSLCMHNIVFSLEIIMVFFIVSFIVLSYFYFLEDISCTATLKVSRINKVYACMYVCIEIEHRLSRNIRN